MAGQSQAGRIAESLMPGQSDAAFQFFKKSGLRAPVIVWSPTAGDLENPYLRRFAMVCENWRDENGNVTAATFDPAKLGALQDWLMIVVPDGDDFRYARYGSGIRDYYGRDMTGETVRAFSGEIADFFEGIYLAAIARREWVLTEHEPPKSVFVRAWRRLIVPLFNPGGTEVFGFGVLNMPENELRAGLELIPDPVFVADGGEQVMFSNGAAKKMFGLPATLSPGTTLLAATGISLEDESTPEDILTSGTVSESLQLTVTGGIAERILMTVSAAEHRGQAFYIVVMRTMTT